MDREEPFTVGSIVALARDASMSTSYKPALLKALVRIVAHRRTQTVPLVDIGEKFVELYWVQTVVFHLRQAPALGKEPEVVQSIRRAANDNVVRRLADLPVISREILTKNMARILKINVLRAFHASAPLTMPQLFEWDEQSPFITFAPQALEFIAANGSVLESIANLWWARYLEKNNTLAPYIIAKVERDGAQRSPLARFLHVLRTIDDDRCFYCSADLHGRSDVHIDHVIPWSFILSDPLWDLVLACRACNLQKSDVLPEHTFLDKLEKTHVQRMNVSFLRAPKFGQSYLPPSDLRQIYSAALSVEWPFGWRPL